MSEVLPRAKARQLIALFVLAMGLILGVPNGWPLFQYYTSDRSEILVAKWVGSKETSSSRDTVAVPAYEFTRRIGPMVQDCRIDLVQYRHAPGGKPKFEVLNLVVGATCTDIIVLDDPPHERIPLMAIGFLMALAGLALFFKARQASE